MKASIKTNAALELMAFKDKYLTLVKEAEALLIKNKDTTDAAELKLTLESIYKSISSFLLIEAKALALTDVEPLTSMLSHAKLLNVTIESLTENPNIAKSIKGLSKEKDLPLAIVGAAVRDALKTCSSKAGEVVSDWKKKISTEDAASGK